jgi:hypothetical protein
LAPIPKPGFHPLLTRRTNPLTDVSPPQAGPLGIPPSQAGPNTIARPSGLPESRAGPNAVPHARMIPQLAHATPAARNARPPISPESRAEQHSIFRTNPPFLAPAPTTSGSTTQIASKANGRADAHADAETLRQKKPEIVHRRLKAVARLRHRSGGSSMVPSMPGSAEDWDDLLEDEEEEIAEAEAIAQGQVPVSIFININAFTTYSHAGHWSQTKASCSQL